MSDDLLDLDALAPKASSLKFEGATIIVPVPTVLTVFKLGALGRKMADIDNLPTEEMKKLIEDLTSAVCEAIPELTDKRLNAAQLMALTGMIVEMGMPTDTKELKKRGITVDVGDDSKKAV